MPNLRKAFPALVAALTAVFSPAGPLAARPAVEASPPSDVSVTMYRDPERTPGDTMEIGDPRGFAMISETRTVTLPAGQSTIRFDGVAEGMVAVTAIVTGLPGGTIEKNRNAELLSPAALVDGTLGNRVRITRTNPGTGAASTESAIVRTRADGGIVLQTAQGFEAVRCSGLPEGLSFDRVPAGLSANPVFSVDTLSDSGGTYQVVLTYLAWGFDWQAHYIATLDEPGAKGEVGLRLLSWLTLLNDNGQSFDNANLLVVAGTLNVESDYGELAEPPTGEPLRLQCYPIGSTAAGSPIPWRGVPVPAYAPEMMSEESIIVTGRRRESKMMMDAPSAIAIVAQEEQLGDLKLYRVPERVNVAAKGLKQIAFLNKDRVRGEFLYATGCDAYEGINDEPEPATLIFATVNDEKHGLGVALPAGGFTLFEPGSAGEMLVDEQGIRDYSVGQDVELAVADSTTVFGECALSQPGDPDEQEGKWLEMTARISNANSDKARVRLVIGNAGDWNIKGGPGKTVLKNGLLFFDVSVPAGKIREFRWKIRRPGSYFDDEES